MASMIQEDNGNVSTMRGMCWVSLLAFVAWGTLTLLKIADPSSGMTLCGMALVGAFAPKAVQKFAEEKVPQG